MSLRTSGRDVVAMKTLGVDIEALGSRIIGAAIEVHRTLGPGFLESTYEEALCVELTLQGIPYARQASISVDYKSHQVGEGRADLIVGKSILVELKAVEKLAPIHRAQVLSYLRATKLRLGLLLNFNVPVLKDGIERIIL